MLLRVWERSKGIIMLLVALVSKQFWYWWLLVLEILVEPIRMPCLPISPIIWAGRMTIKEILGLLRFIFSEEFWRMSVYWTLSLLISYIRCYLWVDESSIYSRQPISGIADKRPVCVITGATSGLGAAAAHALAKEGFFVVLVGRSGHLLSETMSEIRKLNDNAQLEAFVVDLSSFSSIMKFRKSFLQWLLDMNLHSSIQLLINNAGMLATSYRITSDGFDDVAVFLLVLPGSTNMVMHDVNMHAIRINQNDPMRNVKLLL